MEMFFLALGFILIGSAGTLFVLGVIMSRRSKRMEESRKALEKQRQELSRQASREEPPQPDPAGGYR